MLLDSRVVERFKWQFHIVGQSTTWFWLKYLNNYCSGFQEWQCLVIVSHSITENHHLWLWKSHSYMTTNWVNVFQGMYHHIYFEGQFTGKSVSWSKTTLWRQVNTPSNHAKMLLEYISQRFEENSKVTWVQVPPSLGNGWNMYKCAYSKSCDWPWC